MIMSTPVHTSLTEYRPFRKLILAGYFFGLSRQCLIMRDMETLWAFFMRHCLDNSPKHSLPK